MIRDNKTAMPFDISSVRTLSYNANLRIDEVNNSVSEITKALQETESAKEDEINSLLNLLSVEKAVLPNKHKMTADTSLILSAINELSYKLNKPEKTSWSLLDESRNRSEYQKGDLVFFSSNGERCLGKVIKYIGDGVFEILDDNENSHFRRKDDISKAVRRKKSITLNP